MLREPQHRIAFPSREQAAFETYFPDETPLEHDEIAGPTLVSLVSSGTEIALYRQDRESPLYPGYAAVFRAEQMGPAVSDLRAGDLLFCMGPHDSRQRLARRNAVLLPFGLAPETALLARMANMAMSVLATTSARPPQQVFVAGLGLIGLMTAQVFRLCGYAVHACDVSAERRRLAAACGITVHPEAPVGDTAVAGQISLFIDCTGKEADILAGARLVHRGGEAVLIGVPWSRRSGHTAHDVMSLVFHHYVRLRSGWEWELPDHAALPGQPSIYGNLTALVGWLAEGRFRTEGLCEIVRPADAPAVYRSIADRSRGALGSIFDWR